MPPAEVHWCSLKPGDVVTITWKDHHDFRESGPGMDEPCMQRTYGKVFRVSADGVVIVGDEYVDNTDRFSGGFVIGNCITSVKVWGSDGT